MAGKKVEWLFSFLDKVSSPVRKAGQAVDALSAKLERLVGLKGRAEGSIDVRVNAKMPKNLGGPKGFGFAPGGGGSGFGALAELGGSMAGVAAAAAAAAIAMAALAGAGAKYALSTASAKTNLLIGFTTMLKSEDAARSVVAQINKFAAETPFEQADVAKSIRTLMGAQFSQAESFDIFKGLGDVSALDGFNPQALEGMVRVFTQMKAKGKLLSEELNQLAENSGGLLGKFQVQNAIMKLTGKTAEQVGKMLETGKVDAALGAKAILTAIEDNLSGGKLGGVMAKMAREIPGLLSTIKDNLGAELIPSIDDNAGFQAVRSMLRSFADATDRAKPFLKESFGRLFGAVFGGADLFSGEGGQKTFEAMFATLGRGVQRVAQVIETVSPYVRAFAFGFLVGLQRVREVLAPVGAALAKVFGMAEGGDWLVAFVVRFAEGLAFIIALGAAVVGFLGGVIGLVSAVGLGILSVFTAAVGIYTDILDGFWSRVESLAGEFYGLGVNIVDGLWQGIQAGWGLMLESFSALVELLPASVKAVLGIASPSKVFEELGGWTAEGFQVGLEGGQPGVDAAMAQTVAPSVPASSAAAGASAGGALAGVTVQVGDIYVTAPAGASPQDVARLVREALTSQLALELERLAAPIGYQPAPA